MTTQAVLVAVVTYQSSAELPALVRSLPTALQGVPRWRLVFADNASTDGSPELAAELAPEATVLRNGANLGYAAGINACAALARDDEALLVLNADVRLDPGCVATLLHACTDPGTGIAVPFIRDCHGSVEPTLRRRPTALRTWGEALLGRTASMVAPLGEQIPVRAQPAGEPVEADWANGAVMLVPPRARQRVGRWCEEYFLYSEEVDYCHRVREAGLTVRQIPQASAVHRGGQVAQSPALWAQLVTNRVVHAVRWNGRWAGRSGWLALVVAQLLRLPLRRGTHRHALAALLDGRRELWAGRPTNPAAPRAPRGRPTALGDRL